MSGAAQIAEADPVSGISHPHHLAWERVKDAAIALSLGNLCFMTPWFSQLFDADFGYFNKLPVGKPSLLALFVNILWVAAAAFIALRALRRYKTNWLHLPAHLLFFFLLLFPLDFIRNKVLEIPDFRVLAWVSRPWVAVSLALLLSILVWQHRRAARATAILVGFLSPLALYNLCRILCLCLGLIQLEQYVPVPASVPPAFPVKEGAPRVLWIIFDETDQRLAFEQPPAGLKLPEFARLRSESFFATNAFSPGDCTLFSMPMLISGQRITQFEVRNSSDLTLTPRTSPVKLLWSAMPSVFTSARELGFNTALIGWYHPYGRVLDGQLNYCKWYVYPFFEPSRASTFGAAMLNELSTLTGTPHVRMLFAKLFRKSVADSVALVTNQTYGVTLLHLPMPHRPGIYLPDTDSFTIFGNPKLTGYFNNLVLADRSLGKIRKALETSGLWTKTWVIVSTDHSWRDSASYDGKRDLRVPFFVKAPENNRSICFSQQMNTLLTHDLILAILRGEVTNQDNLVPWISKQQDHGPPLPGKLEYD